MRKRSSFDTCEDTSDAFVFGRACYFMMCFLISVMKYSLINCHDIVLYLNIPDDAIIAFI